MAWQERPQHSAEIRSINIFATVAADSIIHTHNWKIAMRTRVVIQLLVYEICSQSS